MSYTLEQLADDIRAALKADPGPAGKTQVCKHVSKALKDQDFIAKHLRAEDCRPRKVLYEDPELGFCICGHVYQDASVGAPHDHGPAWAIYGLAQGDTEMVDWRIVKPEDGSNPILVEREKSYVLRPGDAHYYAPGVVHSPNRSGPTKLIRIEGGNLDRIKRSNIKAAA